VQDLQPPPVSGMTQMNLQALTNVIATTASKAVKHAMAALHQASIPDHNQTAIGQAEHLVDKITNLTQTTGMQGADTPLSILGAGDQPDQHFTSIGINIDA